MAKQMRFFAGLALAATLALPVYAQDKPTADTVVATVNGTVITLGHMVALRESLPEQYKSLPPEVLFKGVLDQLVQQTLLEQSLENKVTRKDTLSLENDRRGYLSNVALQAFIKTAVTDEALQAAYDAKYAALEPETEYSAAHILVDSEEKANDLKKQLEGGADFAALAKTNSSDTGSGANGGDLGWFAKGMMVKPFEDAILAAEKGKVYGPVKTDFGWHLILLKDTRSKAAPALDDVREELAQEIEQKAIEEHVKALTAAGKIEKPGEGIDPALLADTTLIDN
ncbi:MAG: peptidylprolyl isomerase [Cypionkella sp.]|nr:peptidylprolyl isomerase [Cypionkella sp.]